MEKTLVELDTLAKENGFSGAHHAITCAVTYRNAYSNYLHKHNKMVKIFDALRELLPLDMMNLIDKRIEEQHG